MGLSFDVYGTSYGVQILAEKFFQGWRGCGLDRGGCLIVVEPHTKLQMTSMPDFTSDF